MKYDNEWVTTGLRNKRLMGHRIGIDERPTKPSKVLDRKNLNICLTCEMPNCRGSCEKVRRSK